MISVGVGLCGVSFTHVGFAVDVEQCDIEARVALQLALRMVVLLYVGFLWSCTAGAGWWPFAWEVVVVTIAEAVGALGASVEVMYWVSLRCSPKQRRPSRAVLELDFPTIDKAMGDA